MRVSFVRGERRDRIYVLRDDGSEASWSFPSYGAGMPHDLRHFAVESALPLPDGIFGHIARGADLEALNRAANAARGDLTQKYAGFDHLSGVLRSEALANAPWLREDATAGTLHAAIEEACAGYGIQASRRPSTSSPFALPSWSTTPLGARSSPVAPSTSSGVVALPPRPTRGVEPPRVPPDEDPMTPDEQTIARMLIADLAAAKADDDAERAAFTKAIDALVLLAREGGDDTPADELMIPERLAEDELENHLSVLESVPGASEDDVFRWRELLGDLCGY